MNAVIGALRAELSLSTASLETGAAKAERVFDRLGKSMRDTSTKAGSFGRGFDSGIGKGLKGAEASAAAFSDEIDRLKTKFDPLYASSKRYESALGELNRAQKLGAISAQQYDTSLEALNAEFANTGAMSRAGLQAQAFGRSMNGASGHTANLTFQLQDIGMMLAAGQNPLMLAMQQGTQVSGIFQQMGGSAKTIGPALVGAFSALISPMSLITLGSIAAGAAMIQWLTGAGEKAKTASEAVQDFADSVSTAKQAAADAKAPVSALREEYGALAEMVKKARDEQAQTALAAAAQNAKSSVQSIIGTFDFGSRGLAGADYADILDQGTVGGKRLAEQLNVARAEGEKLFSALKALEEARGPLDAANAAGVLRQALVNAGVPLTNELIPLLDKARQANLDLAASSPDQNWMNPAIVGVNELVSRLGIGLAAAQRLKAQAAADLSSAYQQYGASRLAAPKSPILPMTKGTPLEIPVNEAGFANFAALLPPIGSGEGGGSAGRAASAITKLNEAYAAGQSPIEKYNTELAKLDKLKGKGLSDGAYADGVRKLNAELANSSPFANLADSAIDALVKGEDALAALENGFKSMLANIAKEIVKAQLGKLLANSIGGGGNMLGSVLGGAAGGASGGVGNIVGTLLGGASTGGLFAGAATGSMGLPFAAGGGGVLAALGPVGIAVGIGALLFGGGAKRRAEEEARRREEEARQREAAAREAQEALQEKLGLETQILQLQGNTTALRAQELEKLRPTNRELQERIWALEKEAQISTEASGLREQLLRLQGDEAELRRLALEKLDPTNRALQEQVWAMEDAEKASQKLTSALGNLSEQNFASALDFARARGALASGLRVVAGTSIPPAATLTATIDPARTDGLLTNINTSLSLMWRKMERWDVDGLPTVAA